MGDIMNVRNWIKNRIVNLLAMLKHDNDRASSLTILPDYETAFLMALARAYDTPEKVPQEFLRDFYDEFERYLVAVGGKAREDVKEVYTRKEFLDRYMKSLYEQKNEEAGVRLA